MEKSKNIEDVKIGEVFKLKENGRELVRGEYNREAKKYEYTHCDDISRFGLKPKGTKVIISI